VSERPLFENVRADLAWDGSLRDIYVLDTDSADWERLGSTLRASGLTLDYLLQGLPAALPVSLGSHIRDPHRSASLLVVRLAERLPIDCHFFAADEIEFSCDPRGVDGEASWDCLLDFVAVVGQGIGKPVLLTPENVRDRPILSYEPSTRSWKYWPRSPSEI
jgi:hypothetical protein